MDAKDVRVGAIFLSNNGRGPLKAEVLAVYSDGSVKLRRWNPKRRSDRRVFSLPLRFFRSSSCGWVPEVR